MAGGRAVTGTTTVVGRVAMVAAAAFVTVSCGLYYRAGIGLFYREAKLPSAQIRRDVPYAGPASTPRQRLDLYLPADPGAPFVVFVHGGSWDEGSKDLQVGGADVYGNIGRFLALRGTGVAVINYRLLPQVTWQAQLSDVATAVRWVGANAAAHGGSPHCVFVMGHSAGAQLAARVALDPALRGAGGETPPPICGVIGVSGAGYDLGDQETYRLGHNPRFYERRFGGAPDWQRTASPIRFVTRDRADRTPPFLLLYAGGEEPALQRQSRLLHERLVESGAQSTLVTVPGESHSRIVLTLSRDDKTAGPAILAFIRRHAPPQSQ